MKGLIDLENPLTDEDLRKAHAGKQQCNHAQILIQKLRDCGYDCRAEQAMADALGARFDAIVQHFGSGRKNR